MTPEEELGRAAEAEFILSNELFKESVREVRQALIEGIERTAFQDEKLREKLCQQLVALSAVVGKLQSHMETGKLAMETIKRRRAASR
jgi:type II secretory pathway component PulF